jgi:hypothetical protein
MRFQFEVAGLRLPKGGLNAWRRSNASGASA